MSVRIAIDGLAYDKPGADRGLGRYASQLEAAARSIPELEVDLVRARTHRKASSFFNSVQSAVDYGARNADVYHATGVYHLPLLKRLPWVCSVQDVIPLDLDQYRRLGLRTRAHFSNARRVDAILANSRYTADRVRTRLDIPVERIFAAPIPIDQSFFNRSGLEDASQLQDRPYVAALADGRTADPRKRYAWIAQIAPALRDAGFRTVVAGRGLSEEAFPGCTLLRDPSRDQLRRLYANASCFYYPSAYEGQGLPPLEAMATGCPVLAYRNTSVQQMVQIEQFLLEDPVPWERQTLDARIPPSAVKHITNRLLELTNRRGIASSLARDRALEIKSSRLADELLEAYTFALKGR